VFWLVFKRVNVLRYGEKCVSSVLVHAKVVSGDLSILATRYVRRRDRDRRGIHSFAPRGTSCTAPQDTSLTLWQRHVYRASMHVGAQNGERFFKAGKQVTPTRQQQRRHARREKARPFARIKVPGALSCESDPGGLSQQ